MSNPHNCEYYCDGECLKGITGTPCNINGCIAFIEQEKPKCKDCKYMRRWGYDHVCYDYSQSLCGYIRSPFDDVCRNFKKSEI